MLDLKAVGVSEHIARNLTPVLSASIKELGNTSVIGSDDVKAMLQVQVQRDELGCMDDPQCIADIGGALGVDKLVSGDVGKLGSNFVVSLRLIDTQKVVVDNRVTESFRATTQAPATDLGNTRF